MSVAITLLSIALILILTLAAGVILWRVICARRLPVSMCLFPIMPIGLLVMLHSFSYEEWSISWLCGLLLGLTAHILLLSYTISQEKKTAVLEELRETRRKIELEKSHYEDVEQRREELEKIQQDFNAKLETIACAVRSGGGADARESISELSEKINRTSENPYCAVPVINAVLRQKDKDCAAAGITLSVELNLPDTLSIEPMHLCSIFSNILDNALAACKKIARVEDSPVIRLSSITDGDYLIIKAVNPSEKPDAAPAPSNGYGLRILSQLTKQYGGDFRSEYKDGSFTVVLSLLLSR